MIRWVLPIFLILGAFTLFLYRDFFRREPAQILPVSAAAKEELREKILCALDNIEEMDRFYNESSKKRSILTIDLIYERLAEGFAYHGITSDVEKSHFLAQIFHETGNLRYMIETYGINR